jgi:CubicO group peptidase (beta-lactamase class C family)
MINGSWGGIIVSGLRRRSVIKLAGAAGAAAALAPVARASAATAPPAWTTYLTGPSTPTMTSFDNTMLAFMEARGITSGSLAVTTQGRLVKATGYSVVAGGGTLPTAQRITPTTLFRIASISKPVTAAAISRLVQDGQLDLNSPITDLVDLSPPPGQTADPRLVQATVRRVLQHLGGFGDPTVTGFDPMFADRTISQFFGTPLPDSQRQIIEYNSGRTLAHAPGTAYGYSNYGYMLLGRIIETVTGMTYPAYVQQAVLGPLGITDMRQGHSAASLPLPTESTYRDLKSSTTVLDTSGKVVANPYGAFNLENMDSHGAWLASAVDLVRFATIFDLPAGTNVLNQGSVTATFAKPETGVNADGWYYGYGWQVRPTSGGVGYNSWHNGSLDGTWTWLVRTYNGWSWAALFNQRDNTADPTGSTYSAIDSALWTAADAVTSWPTNNLFPQYFGAPVGSVSTSVGQLNAAQAAGPCNDLGATVSVTVTAGLPHTSYTATAGGISTPVTFTTGATGAGSGWVGNVHPVGGWTGNAPITVTAAGKTGTVTAALACSDPRG